ISLSSAVAPQTTRPILPVQMALFGLAAGLILPLVTALAPNRIAYVTIAAVVVAAAMGLGVWFLFGRKPQGALWIFAVVAIACFAGQMITPSLFQLVRPRLGNWMTPVLIQWMATALFMLIAGSLRLQSFRRFDVWAIFLGLGLAVGLLAPLGF